MIRSLTVCMPHRAIMSWNMLNVSFVGISDNNDDSFLG